MELNSYEELAEAKLFFIDKFLNQLDYIREEYKNELSDESIIVLHELSEKLYNNSLNSDSNELLVLCDALESFLTSSNTGFWSDELLSISDMRLLLNSSSQNKGASELNLGASQHDRAVFHSLTTIEAELPNRFLTLRPAEREFINSYLKTKGYGDQRLNV